MAKRKETTPFDGLDDRGMDDLDGTESPPEDSEDDYEGAEGAEGAQGTEDEDEDEDPILVTVTGGEDAEDEDEDEGGDEDEEDDGDAEPSEPTPAPKPKSRAKPKAAKANAPTTTTNKRRRPSDPDPKDKAKARLLDSDPSPTVTRVTLEGFEDVDADGVRIIPTKGLNNKYEAEKVEQGFRWWRRQPQWVQDRLIAYIYRLKPQIDLSLNPNSTDKPGAKTNNIGKVIKPYDSLLDFYTEWGSGDFLVYLNDAGRGGKTLSTFYLKGFWQPNEYPPVVDPITVLDTDTNYQYISWCRSHGKYLPNVKGFEEDPATKASKQKEDEEMGLTTELLRHALDGKESAQRELVDMMREQAKGGGGTDVTALTNQLATMFSTASSTQMAALRDIYERELANRGTAANPSQIFDMVKDMASQMVALSRPAEGSGGNAQILQILMDTQREMRQMSDAHNAAMRELFRDVLAAQSGGHTIVMGEDGKPVTVGRSSSPKPKSLADGIHEIVAAKAELQELLGISGGNANNSSEPPAWFTFGLQALTALAPVLAAALGGNAQAAQQAQLGAGAGSPAIASAGAYVPQPPNPLQALQAQHPAPAPAPAQGTPLRPGMTSAPQQPGVGPQPVSGPQQPQPQPQPQPNAPVTGEPAPPTHATTPTPPTPQQPSEPYQGQRAAPGPLDVLVPASIERLYNPDNQDTPIEDIALDCAEWFIREFGERTYKSILAVGKTPVETGAILSRAMAQNPMLSQCLTRDPGFGERFALFLEYFLQYYELTEDTAEGEGEGGDGAEAEAEGGDVGNGVQSPQSPQSPQGPQVPQAASQEAASAPAPATPAQPPTQTAPAPPVA